MDSIKVLHIVEDLKIGGLEKVIASIVLGLNKDEFKPEVWCLVAGGGIADDLVRKGILVKILKMKSYHNPFEVLFLARSIRQEKADIIHTHGYFGSTFGRMAAVMARTPAVVAHVHTTDYSLKKRNILTERFLSIFTDKIVCVSQAVQRFVEKVEKISSARICVIYNGIKRSNGNIPVVSERNSFKLSNQDIVVITVASLTVHKGHRVLMDAFVRLSIKHKDVKLLIVGDGPLKSDLEAYAREMNISAKMFFTGLREDVTSLLKIADIFFLPSTEREGLGIALIEAMEAGLPVIGTQLGGIPEVIKDHVNGLLVKPGDSEALFVALDLLVSNRNMRDQMGEMGKILYQEKFTQKRMIQEIERLYLRLIKIEQV